MSTINPPLQEQPSAETLTERAEAYRKITVRLIPFLIFLFVLAWLDRVNVGFAKLQMLDSLKFSEVVYGLGAGIFFIGYFLFELPSNLLLTRIGARRTLARITILWGFTSMAMAFVTTPMQFYVLRFLLGVFEAGFFPGVVLYITFWFPAARRGRINGLFMTSFALAGIVGGPLAGLIMNGMNGVGHLESWQWLFVVEGIPSVLAGIAVFFYLPERPANATWLTQRQRDLVTEEVARDAKAPGKHTSLRDSFSAKVWLCAAIYFCIVSGNATIAFWSPSIINELGVQSPLMIGLISAIPFILGTIAMVWTGSNSDRTGERRMHCAVASVLASAGLAMTGFLLHSPVLAIVALSVAAIGILSAFPVFWAIPGAFLTGTAAAGGIAVINSVGNLAGFVSPYMMGWLRQSTGNLAAGLYAVAGIQLMAAVLLIAFVRINREKPALTQ